MTELFTADDFAVFAIAANWGSRLVEELDDRRRTDGLNALLFLTNPDQPFDRTGSLAGLPILIKDNIDTFDLPTTAGSYALSLQPPASDAPLVATLRAAGATILGKTNLSEWANFRGLASVSGWSGRGGITHNPHDPARSAGGSSSGSAVAVGAGYVPVAIGTETDGSVLCPAAANGVVGFKSSVGAIDRTGVIPISRSQDSIGIFANRVIDARSVAEVLVTPPQRGLHPGLVVVDSLIEAFHPKVIGCFEEALANLDAAGFKITRLPQAPDGTLKPDQAAEAIVLGYEITEELDRYLRHRGDPTASSLQAVIEYNATHPDQELALFGQELLVQGLSHPWDRGTYERARITNLETARRGIDSTLAASNAGVIVAPTMGPAWLIDTINGDSDIQANWSIAAVAGYPSLTLPMGAVGHLPIGLMMVGQADTDLALLALAERIQTILA